MPVRFAPIYFNSSSAFCVYVNIFICMELQPLAQTYNKRTKASEKKDDGRIIIIIIAFNFNCY